MEVLYKAKNNSFKKKEILSVDKTDNISKEIWHRRLGHFYQNNLNKYLEMHNIKSPLCIDCKISKMKRIAHNGEPPKAKEKLEVIHSDISGPVNPSIDNKKYFITFMDEFSRKVWIFTLKSKSEAPDIIIDFFKYLNNQFKELSIKKFRTDGGKEYKNKKINKLCKEYSIEKLYSAPYNPEINGKAERINQTLVNAAITLLHWAGMSENFWEYAIKQACYIYNKIPHSGNNNLIPDEVFEDKNVSIKHLRTFGCVCYYKDFTQHKPKFAPNAKKGIFLGFDNQT